MSKQCSVPGCENTGRITRGYCNAHYLRVLRHGDPKAGRRSPVSVNVGRVYTGHTGCSVEGCDKPHRQRGLCKAHDTRARAKERRQRNRCLSLTEMAEARAEHNRTNPSAPTQFLFQHVAHTGDECLIWPFFRKANGYGVSAIFGQSMGAHRAMCFLAHGEPPTPDHMAAHYCGNGHLGCVNPRHLRWATHAENVADLAIHREHGRGWHPALAEAAA